MKSIFSILLSASVACSVFSQNNGKQDVFQKTNNTANKVSTIIAVFQPYLLKAREIYYDSKQLASDVKAAAKNNLRHNKGGDTTGNNNNSSTTNNNILNSSNPQQGYGDNS